MSFVIASRRERARLTNVSPAGEAPLVGKSGALHRFNRLNGAVSAIEENATSVFPIIEC
jgi:hypothetical protein